MSVIYSRENKTANSHDGNSAPRSEHGDSLQTQVHDVAHEHFACTDVAKYKIFVLL